MDILPGMRCNVYITNTTTKPAIFPKFMMVSYESRTLTCIIHGRDDEQHMLAEKVQMLTQIDRFISDPIINDVEHKLPECGNEQVDRDNNVKHSYKTLNTDWCKDLTVPYQHFAYSDKFITMLIQVESMSGAHLGSIRAVQHRAELEKKDERPTHSSHTMQGLRQGNSKGRK